MCNRYTLVAPDRAFAEVAHILGIPLASPPWATARYNIGLMQMAPAVVNRGTGAEVLAMQFGYFAHGSPPLLNNTRAETAFTRRSFKTAAATQRCAIPTTGFIDWGTDPEGRKWPHLFTLAEERPYTLAALWDPGDATQEIPPNFCIVTTEPNELVARIHNRMPMILREEHLARWLDPTPMAEPEFLNIALPFPTAAMREREISDFANNVKHEGPACLAPPRPRDSQLGLDF